MECESGQATSINFGGGFNRTSFLIGGNLPTKGSFQRRFIQQEPFWRRSLWEQAGGAIDTTFHLAADFDLWARFYQHSELYGVMAHWAAFGLMGISDRSCMHKNTSPKPK